jgi:predicted O-methyltransferase YrrM
MSVTPTASQIEELLKQSTPEDAALIARRYLDDYGPGTAVAVCEAATRLGYVDVLLRIVDDDPDYPGALSALSNVTFPGPPYWEVLASLHASLRPATYLEIGVATGGTLSLAGPACQAVGVDPHPERMRVAVAPNHRLYPMTSDEFFARETSNSVFAGRALDLAFIDGMHWFEYVLRDFASAERWCTPRSTILLHDCLPVAGVAAKRERASQFWVGDAWKALECLLDYRPDLHVRVIPTAPSGLVVVRNLDPHSTVLVEHMHDIVQRYRHMTYPHEPRTWSARLPIVGNDHQGLGEALRHTSFLER